MRLALFVSIIFLAAVCGRADAADLARANELVFKRDYAGALHIIKPAAEAGNAEAKFLLGTLHKFGNGVPKDHKEMARLYIAAADKGFARAQLAVGDMYATGEGAEQNYATAVKYFTLAAHQRSMVAATTLAGAYEQGAGVEKDLVRAYMWMLLAEEFMGQSDMSRNNLELLLRMREEIRAQLSREESLRGEQMAQDWKPEVK